MGVLRCGSSCFLKGGDCKAKRDCSCNKCPELQPISPTLYEACNAACNNDDANLRPLSKNAFLDKIGAAELFSRYGYVVDGFDPKQTTEYKLQEEAQKRTASQEGFFQKIIIFGLVVLACVGAFVALKN